MPGYCPATLSQPTAFQGLLWPNCRTGHLDLLNFMFLDSAHLSSLSRTYKRHVLTTGNLRAHTMLDSRESHYKRNQEQTTFTSLAVHFQQRSTAWAGFMRHNPAWFRNPTKSCGVSLYYLSEEAVKPNSECHQPEEEHTDGCTDGREL